MTLCFVEQNDVRITIYNQQVLPPTSHTMRLCQVIPVAEAMYEREQCMVQLDLYKQSIVCARGLGAFTRFEIAVVSLVVERVRL